MKAHTQTQPYATLCVVQVEAGVSQGTDPNGTATRPDYSKLREKSGLPVLYKVLLGITIFICMLCTTASVLQ